MKDQDQASYRVYLLRSWREGHHPSGALPVWRFSLEDPTTRQRRGFATLEDLMSFLAAEMEMCTLLDRDDPINNGQVEGATRWR